VTQANILKLQELLAMGVFPNPRNKEGQTPLHVAAISNNKDAMIALIRSGASLMIKDDEKEDTNEGDKKPLDYLTDKTMLTEMLAEVPHNNMIKVKSSYQNSYNKTTIFFKQLVWKADEKRVGECLTATGPKILQFLGHPFHSKDNLIDNHTSSLAMKSNKITACIKNKKEKLKAQFYQQFAYIIPIAIEF